MTSRTFLAGLFLLAFACAPRDPARDAVDAAVREIGGRAALDGARTLVMEGSGDGFYLGQGTRADSVGGALPYTIDDSKREIDYTNQRWRREQTLTPRWAAQDPSPQREITALDGDVAFDVYAGSASRMPKIIANDRRIELLHTPIGALKAAIATGSVISNHRRDGEHDVVEVRTSAGDRFTLTLDGNTKLPRAVASLTHDPSLGDITVITELTDYQPAGALELPTRIRTKLENEVVINLRLTKNALNATIGDLAAPAAVKTASTEEPAPNVTVEELGPGVWLLAGGTHHSVLVEFADHLTLIEAPLDDARTLAVLAKARELRPAKPLTDIVVTHHHADHSGGVRAAVSEGLTIIAHERSKRFLEELVARRWTIAPDALAKTARPLLQLKTAGAETILGDATRTIHLYAASSAHAETMLVAYIPNEKLLVQVDLYTAPRPEARGLQFPYASTLVDLVESRELDVDRVVALHRQIVPYAQLVAAARSK